MRPDGGVCSSGWVPASRQSVEHLPQGALRLFERSPAGAGDRKALLHAAAPLLRCCARLRADEPLCLEPVQRRIDGAYGHDASRTALELATYRHSVGFVAKAYEREEDKLLELPEKIAFAHYLIAIPAVAISASRFKRARSSSSFCCAERVMTGSSSFASQCSNSYEPT